MCAEAEPVGLKYPKDQTLTAELTLVLLKLILLSFFHDLVRLECRPAAQRVVRPTGS